MSAGMSYQTYGDMEQMGYDEEDDFSFNDKNDILVGMGDNHTFPQQNPYDGHQQQQQQHMGFSSRQRPTGFMQSDGGNRPTTRSGFQGNSWGSNAMPGTAMTMDGTGTTRPMSSMTAAGYSSMAAKKDVLSDNIAAIGVERAPPLEKRSDNSPEDMANEMEREVHALIEASATSCHEERDYTMALDQAKTAQKKERQLLRFREDKSVGEQNLDLSFAVAFNLAKVFHANGMFTESLDLYNNLVKNRNYPHYSRMRVNMGNIHFENGNYPLAIKNYRMALDQTTVTNQDMRNKITKNIAIAFVKLGQYHDAIENFESVNVVNNTDIEIPYNIILCYYAFGDVNEMRKAFKKLLAAEIPGMKNSEDDLDDVDLDDEEYNDELREYLRNRQKKHQVYVLNAARLIADAFGRDDLEWEKGFDWVIEELRAYAVRKEKCNLASEMEMNKALTYLKRKKFQKAIEYLKSFEKKDKDLQVKASTNLSYIYLLEGDIKNAEKYAKQSIKADMYNAKSLVNLGNCHYQRGEFDQAKNLYIEAIDAEVDCTEAMYNLGLATTQLGQFEDAIAAFKKLHIMTPDSIEVIYQLASVCLQMRDNDSALEWFKVLVTRAPTDPTVLYQMGTIYAQQGEETNSFNCYVDSYRYYPVIMDVISWLGLYFVRNDIYENALQYFERAAQIQPHLVDWQLMVASCYNRIGALQQAKRIYEDIHARHPENTKCLECLKQLADKLGLAREKKLYGKKLAKLEERFSTRQAKDRPQEDALIVLKQQHEQQQQKQQQEQHEPEQGQNSIRKLTVSPSSMYQPQQQHQPQMTMSAEMQNLDTRRQKTDDDEDILNLDDHSMIDTLYN